MLYSTILQEDKMNNLQLLVLCQSLKKSHLFKEEIPGKKRKIGNTVISKLFFFLKNFRYKIEVPFKKRKEKIQCV